VTVAMVASSDPAVFENFETYATEVVFMMISKEKFSRVAHFLLEKIGKMIGGNILIIDFFKAYSKSEKINQIFHLFFQSFVIGENSRIHFINF
jgi:hypothetical protein